MLCRYEACQTALFPPSVNRPCSLFSATMLQSLLKALYGARRPPTRTLDPATHFAPLLNYMKQDLPNHRHLYATGPGPCAADKATP
jgi:hypothetical protein